MRRREQLEALHDALERYEGRAQVFLSTTGEDARELATFHGAEFSRDIFGADADDGQARVISSVWVKAGRSLMHAQYPAREPTEQERRFIEPDVAVIDRPRRLARLGGS